MNWLYSLHVYPQAEILQLSAMTISWLTLWLKWGIQFPWRGISGMKTGSGSHWSWDSREGSNLLWELGKSYQTTVRTNIFTSHSAKAFLNDFRKGRDPRIWKYCTTDPPFHFLCDKLLHLALSFEAWDSMVCGLSVFFFKTWVLIKYKSRHFWELSSTQFFIVRFLL